jgi:peptide/nickel transport system substrate-binding protein
MSRKYWAALIALILLAAPWAFAEGRTESAATSAEGAMVGAGTLGEIPMLAGRVESGELPPMKERLPEEPLVLPVREKLGKYGGTFVSAHNRVQPLDAFFGGGVQTFLIYSDGSRGKVADILPNLARDYENNADMTQFTIHMRKGVKWSDGHPFTAADIDFWWNNVLLNDRLTSKIPESFLKSDGTPMSFQVVDDHTLRWSTDKTKPFFWSEFCNMWLPMCWTPAHYMKQFHPDFVDSAALDALIKKEGAEDWVGLYNSKLDNVYQVANLEKPTLAPWMAVKLAPSTPPWIYERNPYYWATDEKGNQLPYVDRIQHTQQKHEVTELQMLNGELDVAYTAKMSLLPEMKAAEQAGKILIHYWRHGHDTTVHLSFNMTQADPVLRQIFRDRRFRIAVSHALNREEMSKLLFFGLLEPRQAMPLEGSAQWERTKHLALKYTEYDPALANRLLDEMGLDKKNSNGYRLRPDGKELFIDFIHYGLWEPEAGMVVDYLKKVGINCSFKTISNTLFWERVRGNDPSFVASVLGGAVHNPNLMRNPRGWVPSTSSFMAGPAWGIWYSTNGQGGEEPIGDFKVNLDKWIRMQNEPDPEKRLQLQTEIITTAVEDLWVVGLLYPPIRYIITSPNLRNVPVEGFAMNWSQSGHIARPETYFFDE